MTEAEGFQTIDEAWRPRILRYVTRLIGAPEAEDLTQEILLKISQGLPAFRGESGLSTWIYRIATNAAIDRIRAAASRKDVRAAPEDDAGEAEISDLWTGKEPLSIEQQLMRKEMYECYERFVEQLPVNYRTVVALSQLEDLSNQQIADILGLSLDTVKIRLHRGREKLLRELKAHCKAEDWL